MFSRALLIASLLAIAASVRGQDAPFPNPSPGAPLERPGLIRIGPIYVTPKLRIGPIGFDTNALWIPETQPRDFRAVGGPALEIVAPMGPARLTLEGGVTYTYYRKNRSERHWGNDARARLDWNRGLLGVKAEQRYDHDFGRPNVEVDRRIVQDRWRTRLDLEIASSSRLSVLPTIDVQRYVIPGHPDFGGTDLTRTLNRTEYRGALGLRCRLTAKTAALFGSDYEIDRFNIDKDRDSDSNRIYGGFEVNSTTRLSGHAVGGARLFRGKVQPGQPLATRHPAYADVELQYRIGPHTRMTGLFTRDLTYSAFTVIGPTPTALTETYGLRLEKDFWRRVELLVLSSSSSFRTDGLVTIRLDSGPMQTRRRDDRTYQVGADLGYRFRGRLRLGIAAIYGRRQSTFDAFGVDGLIVGGTVSLGSGLALPAFAWPR
jgi:hypothetical protein